MLTPVFVATEVLKDSKTEIYNPELDDHIET